MHTSTAYRSSTFKHREEPDSQNHFHILLLWQGKSRFDFVFYRFPMPPFLRKSEAQKLKLRNSLLTPSWKKKCIQLNKQVLSANWSSIDIEITAANSNQNSDMIPNASIAMDVFNSLRIPDAIKDVPTFDGNPRLLFDFINNVEEILSLIPQLNDNINYKKVIIRSIRNKIIGQANEALNMYGTAIDWEEIRNNLIVHYSDKRNETTLIRDLHQIRQNQCTVETFYSEIIEVLSAMINHVKMHEKNVTVIEAKLLLYQEMCLNTFLSGLRKPLGSTIRAMRPMKLTDALNFLLTRAKLHLFSKFSIPTTHFPN